jgi:NAD-dependent deacetylase
MGQEFETVSKPQQLTAIQAAAFLKDRKKFLILTGAGLSAASGVPTFRGNEGFWKTKKNYGGEADPMSLLMNGFFAEKPEAVWEWHYDFIDLCEGKKPNDGHKAITKFQEYCAK